MRTIDPNRASSEGFGGQKKIRLKLKNPGVGLRPQNKPFIEGQHSTIQHQSSDPVDKLDHVDQIDVI